MSKKRLFLIDGSALYFRAYYAMIKNPLTNAQGENVSAIYGFANSTLKIWKDENPDYFAVVFDSKESTFRHELYTDYKANRDEMPEDLVPQLPGIFDFLDQMQVPRIAIPGYEADDILGTLAVRGVREGQEVTIVTSDKDFFQLLRPNLHLFNMRALSKPGEPRYLDAAYLLKKFDVQPEHVIDLLALMGDASDNVPGVAGVGPKTAAKLINEFGGLDSIYASLEKIKSRPIREKLERDRDSAFLSRELVTIQTDVTLSLQPDQLHAPVKLPQTLADWLEHHQFSSLKKFLQVEQQRDKSRGQDDGEKPAKSLTPAPARDLEILQDAGAFRQRIADPGGQWGLLPGRSSTGEVQFLFSNARHTFVVSLAAVTADQEFKNTVLCYFREHHRLLAGFEVKRVLKYLLAAGLEVPFAFFDCSLAAFLLNPDRRNPGLEDLVKEFLPDREPLAWQENPADLLEDSLQVSARAAALCLDLKQKLLPLLQEAAMETLYWQYEIPLIRVLAFMENNGVLLDLEFLKKRNDSIRLELQDLVRQICDLAGEDFNVNSTQQLGRILFEKLTIQNEVGVKRVKKTKTGYSTASETLAQYASLPVVSNLLRYRMLAKLQSTYLEPLTKMADPATGRLFARFNQMVTVTGRLSSTNPNLQNIPIRTPEGAAIRRGFIAPPGKQLLSADYSQVELRILAHLSGDPVMIQAFREGKDIHAQTAARIFDIPLENVTPEQRGRAKAINFGVIYGMGPFRLGRDTGMSVAEAKKFIEEYFAIYQGVRHFIDQAVASARQSGVARTLFGRVRPLPNINSSRKGEAVMAEHMAVNTPIQGTAADLIKSAMVQIQQELLDSFPDSCLLLQVHDELLFEAGKDHIHKLQEAVRHTMETIVPLKVPLKVSLGTGSNWLEAH